MSDKPEPMVPRSKAVRMLTTGFEWEAALFLEVYRELIQRMSKEEAKGILQRAMYRSGIQLGREMRQMVDRDDAMGLALGWEAVYGTDIHGERVLQLDADRFLLRGKGCTAMLLFQRWGLSDEDIQFLADAYCIGDAGHVEGFSDRLHFQHTQRVMVGDEQCVWDFSTKPQEPADHAVKKPEPGS